MDGNIISTGLLVHNAFLDILMQLYKINDKIYGVIKEHNQRKEFHELTLIH